MNTSCERGVGPPGGQLELPLTVNARLALHAFGVEDVDEILDMHDEHGHSFSSPTLPAAATAQGRHGLVPDKGG